MKKNIRLITALSGVLMLSACASTLDKLENVGNPPEMTRVEDPTIKPEYRPMSWPTPAPVGEHPKYANSLWQPGARAFFRDQRAARVGDLLKVRIMIDDKAELDNNTERKRDSQENVGAPDVYGLETLFGSITPGSPDKNSLFDITGTTNNKGEGKLKRKEKIETTVAATVTQVLPNGNFVIEGSQEIRVNYDLREVSVAGVIRPEDIDSDNTIDSTQIAQARINYGGRGQMMDVQQPRWGHQMIDVLSPF